MRPSLAILFASLFLMSGLAVVPAQAAPTCPAGTVTAIESPTTFNDGCYHQYLLYNVDTPHVDALILPPVTGNNAVRDITLIEQSVAAWDAGIEQLAEPWFRDGFDLDWYRVGIDPVPNEALWDPELVVVSASYNPVRFGLLGIGLETPVSSCHGLSFPIESEEEARAIPNLHWHPDSLWASARAECGNGGYTCFVINMEALGNTAGQRRNMYDLVSHEFGHCLGIGHVGDATDFTTAAFPSKDIMAYAVGNHVHCVSTMDLRALEYTYAHLLGQAPNRNTAGKYMRSHPSAWDDVNCAEPTVAMTDTTPLGEADPLGEPKDDDGGSSEDPGQPLILITQPSEGSTVEPGQTFTLAGTVDRDGSTSTSTSTSSTSSSTTTTSSTTTSTGSGPACANDGANGALGLAPAAPPTHDLTRVCLATSGSDLVLTASLADMSVDGALACNESGVSYGFWLNDAASPIEVMCFLGASVANWELEDPFGTAATAEFDYAAKTVTVTVPLAELASVALEAPFSVYAETYNGPGAYGGRPMWLTGTIAGFGLYVDRAPDEGAVAASGRVVSVDAATRLPAPLTASAALGQNGEESLYFTRGTVGMGNADIALGGSLMAPERPTWSDPAVVVTQNQFGGTNVRTIYDATWQYDGDVALDGATIDVTWYASSVNGASGNVVWDVAAYVYSGATAPATDPATATAQLTQALTPTPGEHKATLTGVTGQGDHLVILLRPGFALADNAVSAAAVFYDGADYPSGITVLGDVQPPAAERVEVHEGATLLAASDDLATTGTTAAAPWSTELSLTGDGPHTLTATWMEADGTVLDTAQLTVEVVVSDPCAGVTTGPVLSNISWTAGQDSATITWDTDVASSSVVNFGTTPSYGQYASTPGMTTSHSVLLTGLDAATTYHYQVISAYCGHASESVDNTFTTTGRAASVAVTSPTASSIVQAPVSFAGSFDAGDQGQTRTGTGLVVAEAGSVQWAFTLQGILASPEWQALVDRLEGVKGFAGAVPELDGGATVYLAGKLPKGLPSTVAGFDVTYVKAKPHTLEAPVTPADLVGAQRNSIEQALADWEARTSEPSGPAAPGLPEGIGPGTAMLQGVNGVQYLCSVSYLFQDPNDPAQYYLSTAGHCLLATGQGIDRTGEANPSQVNNHFELCYADCIDNSLGLGSYVVLERTATYEPVAYASAAPVGAADAEGIGRDFGLLRIPKELNGMLRPWLAQWGGPDGLDSAALGDLVVHYGHGTYCCPLAGGVASRTPADQGRVGVAWGTFADGSYETVGWITGGDSGSASGLGAIHADKGVRGTSALGVNTHGLITGVGVFEGTLLSKGQAMVNGKLGFTPRLVLAAENLVTGGGGGGNDPAIAFTSPAEGATLDGGLGAATLTGTATFPDGAGTGTQAPVTYYLHRPGCGDAADVTAMDLLPAEAEEAGNGCGNLGGTRMSQSWPATQDPGTEIPTGSTVVAHVRAFGLRPHPGVVMTGTLTANGVLVGSGTSAATDVIAVALVATPCTEFTMTFTTTARIAADADLVFAASTPQGTQDLPVCYEGGVDASRVVITPLAPPSNVVEVSVDDAAFGAGSLLPVAGTTSWSASWDLAGVGAGEHTLYARLVQDGVAVGPVATRHVTVEAGGERGLRTQLRLVGPEGTTAFDWTTVAAHDGETAGSWSDTWAPAQAASGAYTVFARLMDDDTVLATSNRSFVIDTAPELALPGDQSVKARDTLTFTVSATDADGDALTVSAHDLPAGAAFDAATGVFSWTPSSKDAGKDATAYTVGFTASDGTLQDSGTVTITVTKK